MNKEITTNNNEIMKKHYKNIKQEIKQGNINILSHAINESNNYVKEWVGQLGHEMTPTSEGLVMNHPKGYLYIGYNTPRTYVLYSPIFDDFIDYDKLRELQDRHIPEYDEDLNIYEPLVEFEVHRE